MASELFYTGAGLDRADALRKNDRWLAERAKDAALRVTVLAGEQCLIAGEEMLRAAFLEGDTARAALAQAAEKLFLGLAGNVPYFAADLGPKAPTAVSFLPAGVAFRDLRATAPLLPRAEAALLAYARGLAYWHRRHRFCGDCGNPLVSIEGGHARTCTASACRHSHFPRTDPAVIMLVHRDGAEGNACLLARKAVFPPGMVSVLAGFVEPGESLEEAVAREVMEEVGIRVADIRYQASQPWPFPGTLMLGFRARAETAAITRDANELESAAWFTRADIARLAERGLTLPRADSLALWLIREWLAETA